jgi:septum formation topological specificity factor MinE
MADELSAFVGEGSNEVNPDKVVPKKGKKGKKAADGETKAPKEKKVKEPKPKKDNVAAVNAMVSIAQVRKFLQIAIAKKAKSTGKDEAIARYTNEIESAKVRLNILLTQAGDDLAKLIEMDEEPNKVITHFIKVKEDAFAAWLEKTGVKVGRTTLKNISIDIPESFLAELPLDLHEEVVKRHGKSDFRLQAICRAFNFVAAVDAGTLKYHSNKWMTQTEIDAAKAEADAKAAAKAASATPCEEAKTAAEPQA